MLASLMVGIPLGFALGYFDFPGRRQLRTVVDTLLALPTVFIGLLVYAFLSRSGPLGHAGLQVVSVPIELNEVRLILPLILFP